jgi:ferric-dicitrate binding protein FerR (iron transport regulator)
MHGPVCYADTVMRKAENNHALKPPSARHHIEHEAARWYVCFLESPSAQLREQFTSWLKQSPQHIQAFLRVARTSAEIGASDQFASTDVLIREAQQHLATAGARRRSPSKRLTRVMHLIAALLAFLAAIGISRLVVDRVFGTALDHADIRSWQ